MAEPHLFQTLIRSELENRSKKNPRYSLRAFSKALRVDAPALSRILNGKSLPSPKVARRLTEQLALSPAEAGQFIESIVQAHQAQGSKKFHSTLVKPYERTHDIVELEQNLFSAISDWYHYAILELTFTKDFKLDNRWIAKRLGLTVLEAKLAVERLKNLHLLQVQGGKAKKNPGYLTTADPLTTAPALKKRQRQILQKSIDSLDNDPIQKRNHHSITMAIDPQKIPEAKRRLREFGRSLCEFLESGPRKEIYELSFQLFPLTTSQTSNDKENS